MTDSQTTNRKPGRPPKFGVAMSQAERARQFRRRRLKRVLAAAGVAIDHKFNPSAPYTVAEVEGMSTARLVDALHYYVTHHNKGSAMAIFRLIGERLTVMEDKPVSLEDDGLDD